MNFANDENGFKFITKCSKPDEQCPIGQGWSKYFSDESDIVSQGELETCFPGFHFCKVSILKDMFQAFIQSFLELLQSIRLP